MYKIQDMKMFLGPGDPPERTLYRYCENLLTESQFSGPFLYEQSGNAPENQRSGGPNSDGEGGRGARTRTSAACRPSRGARPDRQGPPRRRGPIPRGPRLRRGGRRGGTGAVARPGPRGGRSDGGSRPRERRPRGGGGPGKGPGCGRGLG